MVVRSYSFIPCSIHYILVSGARLHYKPVCLSPSHSVKQSLTNSLTLQCPLLREILVSEASLQYKPVCPSLSHSLTLQCQLLRRILVPGARLLYNLFVLHSVKQSLTHFTVSLLREILVSEAKLLYNPVCPSLSHLVKQSFITLQCSLLRRILVSGGLSFTQLKSHPFTHSLYSVNY